MFTPRLVLTNDICPVSMSPSSAVGIYLGFFSITVFEFKYTVTFEILNLFLQPDGPDPVCEFDSNTGEVGGFTMAYGNDVYVTGLSGTVGDEEGM